jgi:transposase-like protein
MRRGRNAVLRLAWRRRMERFEASSATVTEFCRREEVSAAAFYQWRRRLSQEHAPAMAEECGKTARPLAPQRQGAYGRSTGFVELTLPAAAVVEVELPNGVRVRVSADQEAALSAIIRAAGEIVAGHGDAPGKEAGRC